ncbi:zinc-binding dehydrogenase [Nocardia sp. CWNU-33]|uniref:zinc-binding dehydrogenase n=1 Tax=Nocardia sp. CWNU-33 TaxID=3392117 RepID=UPI00398F5DA1
MKPSITRAPSFRPLFAISTSPSRCSAASRHCARSKPYGQTAFSSTPRPHGTPGMHERAAELGVRASAFLVEPDRANLESLADLVAKGQLTAHIDTLLPLEQAADAHRLIAQGKTTGKIVLTVADV